MLYFYNLRYVSDTTFDAVVGLGKHEDDVMVADGRAAENFGHVDCATQLCFFFGRHFYDIDCGFDMLYKWSI